MSFEQQIVDYHAIEKYRTQLAKIIAKGVAPSEAHRVYEISEGVVEVKGRDFQAAIQTDDGHKLLSGILQSDNRRIPSLKAEFTFIETGIKDAYTKLDTDSALSVIGDAWSELDRLSELAAARSRILLGRKNPVATAPTPDWFLRQISEIRSEVNSDEDMHVSEPAIESAEMLVKAAAAANITNEANCDVGPLGRLMMDWALPVGSLTWMVEGVDLPWPSVRVYEAHDTSQGVKNQIIHDAFKAIDSLSQCLHPE